MLQCILRAVRCTSQTSNTLRINHSLANCPCRAIFFAEAAVIAMMVFPNFHADTTAKSREDAGQGIFAGSWDTHPFRGTYPFYNRQQSIFTKGIISPKKSMTDWDISTSNDLATRKALGFVKNIAVGNFTVNSNQNNVFCN